MQQLPLAISPPVEPDFRNFVPGANAEVLAGVRALAAGTLAEAVIYLWGEPGSGRSHLLRAAARENPRLFIADDVETLEPQAQQALFMAINAAREGREAVLAAGAAAPPQLPVREDLRTRLAWGLVYRMRPLTDEEKRTHLRAQARSRGLQLSEEIIGYLLSRLPRDMSNLSEVMEVLDRYSLVRQRPLTLPLVREALACAQQSAQAPRQIEGR